MKKNFDFKIFIFFRLTPLINIHSRISLQIFKKIWNGPNGILIYEKNLMSKISCQTPFKIIWYIKQKTNNSDISERSVISAIQQTICIGKCIGTHCFAIWVNWPGFPLPHVKMPPHPPIGGLYWWGPPPFLKTRHLFRSIVRGCRANPPNYSHANGGEGRHFRVPTSVFVC